MNPHVIKAIFKRNFVSYFSNPTGYVFICVFVLLSSSAAFWPAAFFDSNLANLDQLNKVLPYILLVFVPAITMSIWAEERRQGTDELLLTIPAGDFDVVSGKYLAAVAIYSVSLLFSFFCNLAVLSTLGQPDMGLFAGTYFGYWVVGLAMLAIGMVASFLTSNLTVGFILGVVFNAVLIVPGWIDVIPLPQAITTAWPDLTASIEGWSVQQQFSDFSRGVISFAAVAFFLSIVALMLYLSMVLIGRRHWRGGREGRWMAAHYAARFVALLVVVAGLTTYFYNHDQLRIDVTTEGLGSLSDKTHELVTELADDKKYPHPVTVEAYISNEVPESYVKTRLNLLSVLQEFRALNPNKLRVKIHTVEPFSEQATLAEEKYGIQAQPVLSPGQQSPDPIFMGAAFTCGLEKVVVPFFDRGIPVEYEVVRSIATVSQQERKKLGVLMTDAKLYGGFDPQTMRPTSDQMIVEELRKQYEVVQVDASNPITEKFDVLLAVQPSSLNPQQMENFVAAVRTGQPTAIFEDPFPALIDAPGTAAPKQPPGGANPFMMNRQPPQPKGDINQLWKTLGIKFTGSQVVWQDYNPHPFELAHLGQEFVFVVPDNGAREPFNQNQPISSNLQELLLPFPGAITEAGDSNGLKFTELLTTGELTGTVDHDVILERSFMGAQLNPRLPALRKMTGKKYVLAAHVKGKLPVENLPMSDKEAGSEKQDEKSAAAAPRTPTQPEVNAVVVGDIDCLSSAFFNIRAQGDNPYDNFGLLQFDNVTFVLNTLDYLAGDERFLEIRKRRPTHRTLTTIAKATDDARAEKNKAREKAEQEFNDALQAEQKRMDERVAALRKARNMSAEQKNAELMILLQDVQRRMTTTEEQLKKKREQRMKEIERELAREVRAVQNGYKLRAVMLPPILPMLVALFVFFNRRAREREGVSKARLR